MSAIKTALSFSAGPWDPTHRLVTSWLLTPWQLFLCRTVLIHLFWLAVLLLAYLAMAYITVADQKWYPYVFLNPELAGGSAKVALYIVCIALGLVAAFCLTSGLIWLRRWLTETKLGMGGRVVPQPRAAIVDQEKDAMAPDAPSFQNASGSIRTS